ncbi:hypothetical protein JXJ21_03925 [candidate division KSB1 bacterium]|nr:hypothetical protein [candidate division KSB1 bacterium]
MKFKYLILGFLLVWNCSEEDIEKLKDFQKRPAPQIAFPESKIRVKDRAKTIILRIECSRSEALIKDREKQTRGRLIIDKDKFLLSDQAGTLIWQAESGDSDSTRFKAENGNTIYTRFQYKNTIRIENQRSEVLYELKLKSSRRFELHRRNKLIAKGTVYGDMLKIKDPKGNVLFTVHGAPTASALYFAAEDFSQIERAALFLMDHRAAVEEEPQRLF